MVEHLSRRRFVRTGCPMLSCVCNAWLTSAYTIFGIPPNLCHPATCRGGGMTVGRATIGQGATSGAAGKVVGMTQAEA